MKENKKCIECNKKFYKKSSESKKYWNTRKYCSMKCQHIKTSQNLVHGINKGKKLNLSEEGLAKRRLLVSGSNNYFWEGGKSNLRR